MPVEVIRDTNHSPALSPTEGLSAGHLTTNTRGSKTSRWVFGRALATRECVGCQLGMCIIWQAVRHL